MAEDPAAGAPFDQEMLDFAHTVFDLARDGQADRLAAYLDAGLTPNLTNDKGDNLLILAAYRGHPETVKTLLEHGAATDSANDRGQTALAAAVFKQSEESVRLLLDAGADENAGSPSAIDTARFFELPAMIALLDAKAGR